MCVLIKLMFFYRLLVNLTRTHTQGEGLGMKLRLGYVVLIHLRFHHFRWQTSDVGRYAVASEKLGHLI